MSINLPNIIDPLRLAPKGAYWDAIVPIAALPTLAAMLVAPENLYAKAQVHISLDAVGRCVVAGVATADVTLVCQRCLDAMPLTLSQDFNIGIVQQAAQVASLPEAYDPWIVTEEGFSLWDVVEVSLILAIPDAPKHAGDLCQLPNIENRSL